MVISEELVQEINSLGSYEALVVRVDKALPRFLGKSAEYIVILSIEFDVVSIQVLKEFIRTKDLCDLHQLV